MNDPTEQQLIDEALVFKTMFGLIVQHRDFECHGRVELTDDTDEGVEVRFDFYYYGDLRGGSVRLSFYNDADHHAAEKAVATLQEIDAEKATRMFRQSIEPEFEDDPDEDLELYDIDEDDFDPDI